MDLAIVGGIEQTASCSRLLVLRCTLDAPGAAASNRINYGSQTHGLLNFVVHPRRGCALTVGAQAR